MGQYAPRINPEASAAKALTALVCQLPGNARVRVDCKDGKSYTGLVCVRPTIQSFRNRDRDEGVNGVLRLEDASAPGGEHHLWLDQIVRVHRLDAINSKFAV